jgi:hypothetical protein
MTAKNKTNPTSYLCGHRTPKRTVLDCTGEEAPCPAMVFAQAELTYHHDKTLAQATKKIEKIIAQIPPDADGRKLDLAITTKGLLLIWVNRPGTRIPAGAETFCDRASIERELKLK